MRDLLFFIALVVAGDTDADGISACRQIAEPEKRLTCYDAAVDQSSTTAAPEAKFGAAKPVPDAVAPEPTIDSIDAVIAALHTNGLGKWVIDLDNGQTWTQTDSTRLTLDSAERIVIHKGRFGSYRLEKASGSRGISVKRTR
jgi:hypothetical protein